MGVAANLARINEELAGKQVRLIAVTKKAEPSQMEEAFGLGVTEFGENRIQDALAKREKLSPSLVQNAKWHFIGHLQTNKVKQAVGNFSLIHSVDSLKLGQRDIESCFQPGDDPGDPASSQAGGRCGQVRVLEKRASEPI